ncbi:MAG: hypothetical protein HPY55_10485 [Firmicutes bacterium]|nr:hypothetical protein [Bacillota bacterium]
MLFGKIIVAAAMGGLAAALAQKGIAVFHDGLRPVMPEFLEGRMKRRELALTSFALSFGLVVGYGIPVSLTGALLLIHSVFLATDIIAAFSPSTPVAAAIGALYGGGIAVGLQWIVNLIKMLPVNFLGALGDVGTPIVVAFAVFPALAVGYQYGARKGIYTLLFSLLVRQLVVRFSPIPLGTAKLNINPEGSALVAGMVFLLMYAMREKAGGHEVDTASIFANRVTRIKKNLPYLAVMGALVGIATQLHIVAGDPISLNLVAKGNITDAAIAAFARAIGFIPLVGTTAIATGVYGPVGMTLVFGAALLSPNPVVAGILGAAVIGAEVLFLDVLARFMDRYPGIRRAGEHIRTAMTKVLEIALLVGGMTAGNSMAPGLGFFLVAGVYILNEIAGMPITRMAVGPVAAILVGVAINILKVLGLFIVPVK